MLVLHKETWVAGRLLRGTFPFGVQAHNNKNKYFKMRNLVLLKD